MIIKNLKIAVIFINTYFVSIINAQTVSDVEGNIYNTTMIGNQVWLSENLRSTKFSNGDTINLVQDSIQWSLQTSAAYCYYKNNTTYINPYGNLYNWYTVNDSRNICPSGYHVPSTFDWDELVNYLGGPPIAGGKLKQIGFNYWLSPNTDADNTSGFSAVASGWRAYNNGAYENLLGMCYLWSATVQSLNDADIVLIGYDSPSCYLSNANKLTGLPVRCIQNSETTNLKNYKKAEINIFPNPFTDELNIAVKSSESISYEILTPLSQIVTSGYINIENQVLKLYNLPSGIYYLKVSGLNIYKIIKQ